MSNPATHSRANSSSVTSSSRAKQSAYLVGVCGSGMKALAEVLVDRGWRVAGSDLQAESPAGEALRQRGVTVFPQHSADQIPADVELLVYSSAVKSDNPERTWAREYHVASFAYHEMLGELMRDAVGISIAGTHGKSTTTAMTGCILTTALLKPTVLVGAEVCGTAANGWSGGGRHFVAESCEYQRHFLSLHPQFVTILGIEEDHFDCFRDVAETIAAFHDFAMQVPADGVVIIHRE
jgi:UDP-N-acetylmuramate--alanine ligase